MVSVDVQLRNKYNQGVTLSESTTVLVQTLQTRATLTGQSLSRYSTAQESQLTKVSFKVSLPLRQVGGHQIQIILVDKEKVKDSIDTLRGEMLSFGAASNRFAANIRVNHASGVGDSDKNSTNNTTVRSYLSPDDIDIKLDIVSKYVVRTS